MIYYSKIRELSKKVEENQEKKDPRVTAVHQDKKMTSLNWNGRTGFRGRWEGCRKGKMPYIRYSLRDGDKAGHVKENRNKNINTQNTYNWSKKECNRGIILGQKISNIYLL